MDIDALFAKCRNAIERGDKTIVITMSRKGRVGQIINLYAKEGGPKGRVLDEVEDGRLAVEFNPGEIVVDMMLRIGRAGY